MKKLIILFLISTLSLSTYNCSSKKSVTVSKPIKPQKQRDLAMEYYLKGRKYFLKFTKNDVKTSIKYFKMALRIRSHFPLALAGLAEAISYYAFQRERNGILSQQYFDKALTLARKAIKLNPNIAEAHRAFSWYFLASGLHGYASLKAKDALKRNPSDPESFFLLWASTENNNIYSSKLKKAIKSNFVLALLNAGSLERRSGNYDKALFYFSQVIKLIPNHIHALVNIGNVYLKLKQYEDSKKYYVKALNLQKNDSYVYFNYAAMYVSMRQYRDAEKFYKKAVKINPNFILAHKMLCKLYKIVFKNKKLYVIHKKAVRKLSKRRLEIQIKRMKKARNDLTM